MHFKCFPPLDINRINCYWMHDMLYHRLSKSRNLDIKISPDGEEACHYNALPAEVALTLNGIWRNRPSTLSLPWIQQRCGAFIWPAAERCWCTHGFTTVNPTLRHRRPHCHKESQTTVITHPHKFNTFYMIASCNFIGSQRKFWEVVQAY